MKLSELRDAVDRRSGVAFGSDALNDVLNEALTEIATDHTRWPWLEQTITMTFVEGQAEYLLPFGCRAVRYVTVDGQAWPRRQIADLRDVLNLEDRFAYAVDHGALVFFPTPGADGSTVVVDFQAVDGPLEQDSDEPLLPEEWHLQVLVPCATAKVLDRVRQKDRADACRAEYASGMRRMKRSSRSTTGPQLPRVRPGVPF